ncbi:MAG: hypothetical protein WBQ25_21740 [Nitrososphaeraceae archaeon]
MTRQLNYFDCGVTTTVDHHKWRLPYPNDKLFTTRTTRLEAKPPTTQKYAEYVVNVAITSKSTYTLTRWDIKAAMYDYFSHTKHHHMIQD